MTGTTAPEWLRRLTLRLTDPANRPLPRITVESGPTLPGWALHALLLVLTPLLFLTATINTPDLPPGVTWTLAALATGLLVAHPTPATAGGTIVLSGVLMWGFTTERFDPYALVVALIAYTLTRTTWWAAHVPLRGHVEIAALLAGWRRDIVVLAATALLGALAAAVSGTTHPLAALVAALAIVTTTLVALANGRAPRDDGATDPN